MNNDKKLLVYGLSEDEINLLKALSKVTEIKPEMLNLKVHEIANEKINEEIVEVMNGPNEKIILFNGFSDGEVNATVRKIRKIIQGGVLAVVTPVSRNWTFKYLAEHLLEEREWYLKQQKENK